MTYYPSMPPEGQETKRLIVVGLLCLFAAAVSAPIVLAITP